MRTTRLILVLMGLLLVGSRAPLPAAEEANLSKKALQLNLLTGIDPITGQIVALLDDPPGSKKLLAAARKMLQEKKESPFNANAAYVLARTAHGLKDVESAKVFYELLSDEAKKLESIQKLVQAQLGLMQMYYDNKDFAECVKVCNKFVEMDGDESVEEMKPRVERLMLTAMARDGKAEDVLTTVERKIKLSPNNLANLEFKGQIQRIAGKLEESAQTYEDLIEKIKKDPRFKKDVEELIADIRYSLSGVYVEIGQVNKAADHLKVLLTHEPNNPTYNNDLGYIWADHDMNLDESERLVRKAIEEDRKQRLKDNPELKPESVKDNPSYLDSLGWVLFKQKKYAEAKPPLLQAIEQEDGKHLEIYDHLGDVLWQLGEKTEAVDAWKKAIEVARENPREEKRKAAVEKKLKEMP